MKTKIILAQADALAIPLPDNVVHCVVTSPPYWALRDYGVGVEKGELGQEPLADCRQYGPSDMTRELLGEIEAAVCSKRIRLETLRQLTETWRERLAKAHDPCGICHVCNMVRVFREVRRVMHPSGTLWLNYGDMYAQPAPQGRYGDLGDLSTGDHGELGPRRDLSNLPRGVKKGDKLLMHARIALALQADGWWLRSVPIWRKTNPMPSPAQQYRRPVDSYEPIYLFAKDYRRYFYDAEAVREPRPEPNRPSPWRSRRYTNQPPMPSNHEAEGPSPGRPLVYSSRHLRDVWDIPTQGWKGAHFACYPERLVEPCIKAGTSEFGVCAKCKSPWRRVLEKAGQYQSRTPGCAALDEGIYSPGGVTDTGMINTYKTTGWVPTCECGADVEPALVFDPFVGSGTTCKVARDLGRTSVGLDISLEYLLNEASERLITFNGRRPTLGLLRRAEIARKPVDDLPLFGAM